jgi:hypothetical protein
MSVCAALDAIMRDMTTAAEEAATAYAFAPSSYTFSTFAAVQSAQTAFAAVRAVILEHQDAE